MKVLAASAVATLALAVPTVRSASQCHVKLGWTWHVFPTFTLKSCPVGARNVTV